MNKKYEYFQNGFLQDGDVSVDEIKQTEEHIGFELPKSLKEFWLEMGYGSLNAKNVSEKGSPVLEYMIGDPNNEIFSPLEVEKTILIDEEDSKILPYILEDYLQEGDVPFFHVSNSDYFLKFRLNSDKPEAIYDMYGDLIEESFEKFIWRLYHESPDYYLHLDEPKQL